MQFGFHGGVSLDCDAAPCSHVLHGPTDVSEEHAASVLRTEV
jgi:hypothetical protein